MVIVAGFIDVDPDQRERFLAEKQDGIAESRAEDGCIEYVFSADSSDPGRIRIFERWESAEALGTHLAALAAAPAEADPVARARVELLRYHVASVDPLIVS